MDDVRLTVLDQLDQLEEVVLEGSRLPFTGGRLVNEGDAVEVLDAVRDALPKEIERAAKLIERRDDFINTARQQAEDIVQDEKAKFVLLFEDLKKLEHALTAYYHVTL